MFQKLILTSSLYSSQLSAGLQLGERNEVSATAETRKLYFCGSRLILKTPTFYRKTGLKFVINPKSISMLVPLDEGTRNSLQTVEEFVKTQMAGERYKPLFLGNAFHVNVSRFCKYEQVMPDGSIEKLAENNFLNGSGDYVVSIHVSHCYIGPHKGGETYSISLQVAGILHRPRVEEEDEEDVMDLIESLTQEISAPPRDTLQEIAAPPPAMQQQQPQCVSNLFSSSRPSPYLRNVKPIAASTPKKKSGGRRRGMDVVDASNSMN